MTEELIQSIVEGVVPVVLAAVSKQMDARIAALPVGKDGAPGPQGEKGDAGVPGKDADFAAIVMEVTAAIPKPIPGPPGKDATVDFSAIAEQCRTLVAALPKPKDGEPGKDGKGLTVDDVRPLFELAFAKWETDFERRAQDVFAKAIERMPKAKDGIDGLGFDDLSVEHDGSGLIYLHFVRGEQRKDFELRLPCFRDRGVYSEESKDYREGHGTTWGGSYFIAQKDNPQGRPGESDDWRLAVKRGRDGKDGTVPALLHKPVALK